MIEVRSCEDSSIYVKARERIEVGKSRICYIFFFITMSIHALFSLLLEKDVKSKKAIDDAFDEFTDLLMNS